MLSHFSCVWLFATPWTVAHKAPLSMVFSRQDTVVGCQFLLRGSSWHRDWTWVSCIASRFFTVCAINRSTYLIFSYLNVFSTLLQNTYPEQFRFWAIQNCYNLSFPMATLGFQILCFTILRESMKASRSQESRAFRAPFLSSTDY